MSANAIGTLRHARGNALAPAHREAVEAVEALLEAAKALIDSHGNPNDPTLPSGTYTLGGRYLSQEHFDALAAAVRRVDSSG